MSHGLNFFVWLLLVFSILLQEGEEVMLQLHKLRLSLSQGWDSVSISIIIIIIIF